MDPRPVAAACCVLLLAVACTSSSSGLGRPGSKPTPAVKLQYLIDGQPVTGTARVGARSHLRLAFTTAQRPVDVRVAIGGEPVPRQSLAWSDDRKSLDVPLAGLAPYGATVPVVVSAGSNLGTPAPLMLSMVATVPANARSGVQPGFRPRTPVEAVVENSGPARPQAGFQDADIVYEYLSEYSTTRMTAIYFNHVPGLVGPLRSCRMINPYLAYAYSGIAMCTGVSDGTAHWMYGEGGAGVVPSVMEPSDRGGHFFRVGFRAAPHNAYTSGDRAERLRSEAPMAPGDYAVDPPHDDLPAGQPAEAPSAPLHSVGYAYDAGGRQYLRSDHGTPLPDQNTGTQLYVKTVVLMHVPFHDGGWIEDDNGGAHSVWYHMLGSGPAEVYSDGLVVHATWHMGSSPGQAYWDNHSPVWFTDEAGHVILLNTGLTWIHVLGIGQERCPDSPAAC